MLLAIFAEILSVSVNNRSSVVIQTSLDNFVHWQYKHDAKFFSQSLKPFSCRPIRNWLRIRVVLGTLNLTKIRAVKQFLEAHNLCTLSGCFKGLRFVLVDHRAFVAGPIGLQQRCSNCTTHDLSPYFLTICPSNYQSEHPQHKPEFSLCP